MTIANELADLRAFAAQGGWTWAQPEDAVFAFRTGDPDDVCSMIDGAYAVSKHERGSISSPLMVTDDLEVLDRFLTLRYGHAVRSHKGLPRLARPIDVAIVASPPAGVSVDLGPDGYLVEWSEGDRVRRAWGLSTVSAARLIEYGRRPAVEIRRQFESPESGPLRPRVNADSVTLSAAIVEYLGWGRSPMPTADRAAVAEVARVRGVDETALLTEVQRAVDATNAIDLGETPLRTETAGPEFKARFSAARPDLSGAAVDALASRWFFERLWIGRASDPAPRFFALFAAREGQAVPMALFRRRVEAGHTIDEVLHDVDTWRPDARGRVQHAIKRYLDSDLDEISPARAAEFERMVADRSYRPFTAPWMTFPRSAADLKGNGDDRLGASVTMQAPPIAPGVLRPGGVYARTGDEWYLSTQSWAGHTKLPWVELRKPRDGGTFRVPVGAVQATTRVTPEVEYEGFWFDLGSLWTVEPQQGLLPDSARIWDPTPLAAPDCFALLLFVGDHTSGVLELPGARHLNDRSSNGGVTLTVRLSDVSDYRETVEAVTVEQAPE